MITGAAGGIGAEVARQVVSRGAQAALLDVRADALQSLASELAPNATAWVVDTTDLARMEHVAGEVLDTLGALDVVVANAGVQSTASVVQVDPSDFDRVINVNLLGSWRTARATLTPLARSNGYLLFVSSLSAVMYGPLQASYNASKAGINALATSMRLEVEGAGVSVGIALLSYTATDTGRAAVEHPSIRQLRGMRIGRPLSVNRTAAALVRGIERRSRRIVVPASSRAFLLAPNALQWALEANARRQRWSTTIAAQDATPDESER
jgi:NAD(P)-dependent dehydrogenase (short-subunit alcohol dehydrogenase family)